MTRRTASPGFRVVPTVMAEAPRSIADGIAAGVVSATGRKVR
jgi:hypothetical protein